MIQVDTLRKTFGPITAVDGISFSAQQGDVVGFLGPNGAGKTTAMRMLTGFLTPDSGSAQVCGHDILQSAPRCRFSGRGRARNNSHCGTLRRLQTRR